MTFGDLILLLIMINVVDIYLLRKMAQQRAEQAVGMFSVKEWAQRYLHYSWANDYLPLNQLDECFSSIPRNQEGEMIYIFPADFHGVPMAGGLANTAHHLAIGYWTDGFSCAKAFLYKRNRKGILMVTAIGQGSVPQKAPHPPHSVDNLPGHWQKVLSA